MKWLPKIILSKFLLTFSVQSFAQHNSYNQIDTTFYTHHSVNIQGKKYDGYLYQQVFYLINFKADTILTQIGDYFSFDFKDFNKDGYKDIFLDKGGNTPETVDLLLYNPSTHSFKMIKGFDNYPAPERINQTKLFYSYHRSGCADMNWDSDLFYIHNFKVIKLGNISGRQCENSGEKDGLYVNKFKDRKKILIKTMPIETIKNYKNNKWSFIKEYWYRNYKEFL